MPMIPHHLSVLKPSQRINVFYISDLTQVWEVYYKSTMSGFTPKHINENKLKAFSLGAMGHKAASRSVWFKTYLRYLSIYLL